MPFRNDGEGSPSGAKRLGPPFRHTRGDGCGRADTVAVADSASVGGSAGCTVRESERVKAGGSTKGWLLEMKKHNRHMAKFGAGLVLAMVGALTPQLAAFGEPRYPILDSTVPVDEQTHPVWLNNSQIIFIGYELDPAQPPKQAGLTWEIPQGVYVWDLEKGTAARDHSWDGTSKWCVSGKFRSFYRLRQGTEKIYELVQEKAGEEQVLSLPAKHWFNGSSCRYYAERPYWIEEGRRGRGFPLLEKHGYVDFGEQSMDPAKARPLVLYPPGSRDGIVLPLKSDQVEVPPIYVEFADAYLLRARQFTSDAVPAWLLKPDGSVTTEFKPTGQAWERMGWEQYFFTRKGLLFTGGRGDYAAVGTMGGYLLNKGKPVRVVPGMLKNAAVSPNGCQVAFVHELHSQAGADSIKALRAGKPGSRTLKTIDFCIGEGE